MHVRLILQQSGGTTTGFVIPDEVVDALGGGRRPKVVAIANGYSWRTSIANMGGVFMLGASAEVRGKAGIAGGDEVDLDIELDTAPREIEVPAELQVALAANPAAAAAFGKLSFSHQRQHVDAITAAKAAETKARRVASTIAKLTS